MKRVSVVLATLLAAAIGTGLNVPSAAQTTSSQQADIAQKAAEEIVSDLGNQKYKTLWDKLTSDWFKNRTTENAFLSNLSVGRAQFGSIQTISLVSSDHSVSDPTTNYQGDIYAFTFRDKYPVGEFFERIVVIKDADGRYRMSGLFGSPVPSQ